MTFSELFLLHFKYTEAVLFNMDLFDVCNRLISRCLVDITSKVNYAWVPTEVVYVWSILYRINNSFGPILFLTSPVTHRGTRNSGSKLRFTEWKLP